MDEKTPTLKVSSSTPSGEPESLLDLMSWEPEREVREVRIGPVAVKLRGIHDPTRIRHLFAEGEARATQAFKIGQETVYIDEAEAGAYAFLVAGLTEESLGFEQVVAISRKTGMDCLNAGGAVMELSGLTGERVDEVKNG